MKTFVLAIKVLQNLLVGGSVLFLMVMPIVLALFPETLPREYTTNAFFVSLCAVTWVMAIRPLADLLPGVRWIRMLVILRKGFGVLSASIIVSFMLAKIVDRGLITYFAAWLTPEYWSLHTYALLAHVGDATAIILLITSNNMSKRILGKGWKRVQKLAYVYFYAGAFYEALAFQSTFAYGAIVVVTLLVFAASLRNLSQRRSIAPASPAPTAPPIAAPNTVRIPTSSV